MNVRASNVAAIAVLFCAGLAHYLGTVGPFKSAAAVEPGERHAVAANEANAPSIALGLPGFQSGVSPFFKTYCVKCHGPEKSKGGITVHSLNGDLSAGQELDKWESVLEMLESGEMPPIDEPQPTKAEAQAVKHWIESGMRDYVLKASAEKREARTRRLTNVEYENTLSDLLGFEFDVIDDLPEDPTHYYHFNNTAELMRIGPEQLDRYLEIARKAMRSAIVDRQKPEVFKWRGEWSSAGSDKGLGEDEITAFSGKAIGLSGAPRHGEFRLRFSASAILPPGHDEVTLQLNMGDYQGGDHNEKASKNIATFTLDNSPDKPKDFEFRGRIENHPFSTELETKGVNKGKHVDKRTLRINVIYDDGTLNDGQHYAFTRQMTMPRAVVNWIEFEAPVIDAWTSPPTSLLTATAR